MPHYSFIVPEHTFDEAVSVELPDRVAARREAIVHVAAVLRDRPSLLGLSDTTRVQVHDEADRCLFIVNVQVIDVVAED